MQRLDATFPSSGPQMIPPPATDERQLAQELLQLEREGVLGDVKARRAREDEVQRRDHALVLVRLELVAEQLCELPLGSALHIFQPSAVF